MAILNPRNKISDRPKIKEGRKETPRPIMRLPLPVDMQPRPRPIMPLPMPTQGNVAPDMQNISQMMQGLGGVNPMGVPMQMMPQQDGQMQNMDAMFSPQIAQMLASMGQAGMPQSQQAFGQMQGQNPYMNPMPNPYMNSMPNPYMNYANSGNPMGGVQSAQPFMANIGSLLGKG